MNGYLTVIAVLLLLLAAALVNRWRTQCVVKRLEATLTAAIEGRPAPSVPDDGRISELERRFGQYLASNERTARSLREQRQQIDVLFVRLAQQTKDPVNQLLRCVQQLEKQPLTPQGRDCARAVSDQAERLQTRIELLVQTSRVETGALALHPQKDELGPVVTRGAARYAPRAWDKEVSLTVGQGGGEAVFDAKWTEEALCCLLDNAVKYTPSGGSIRVEVQNGEEFSGVRVSDTGPGISEKERSMLLSGPFRAVGTSPEGMGLRFAQQIARCQGGYVDVESVLGKGSTFTLYLPRAKEKKKSARPRA